MSLHNFKGYLNIRHVFRPDQIKEVLSYIRKNFRFSVVNTKHKYFNVPASFDIETSSFYDGKNGKVGLMYAWVFGVYGLTIIGRTWDEFITMINELVKILDLGEKKRLIVYVHNLAFDFAFFCSHFTWEKVFAIDRRRPLYALTDTGIEFRCSYLLSGYSLDTIGKNLLHYKISKMTGDLNYNLIRTPETELSREELHYIQNDSKVVMAYIAEEIERLGGIALIPYTKTGHVRVYCRHKIFYNEETGKKDRHKSLNYRDLMQRLTMDVPLYKQAKRAFAGGFTHANAVYVDQIIEYVASMDFTSDYPAQMIKNRFPMGEPEKIECKNMTRDELDNNIDLYCCIFTIHIYDMKMRPDVYESYISRHKCIKIENPIVNNGRVVSADYCELTITEVDYKILIKIYEWRAIRVSNFYRFIRGWLPKDFVLAVLDLYKKKTELKGVKGKEAEYLNSKEMLNSCYGMAVMDPWREINTFTDHWLDPELPDLETTLDKSNKKGGRFLYYPWGIYVTAYARYDLFQAILKLKDDYIYSDTDSVKFCNYEKHKQWFDDFNKKTEKQLIYALNQQNIPLEYIRPKTIKGIEKVLGFFDFEGISRRFKTLGAKRYLYEDAEGQLNLTVSGVNKKVGIPYLWKKYGSKEQIFEEFKDGLFFPAGASGKQTHTYIDDTKSGKIEDYQGNKYNYKEKTGIHLEPAEYRLSIHGDFMTYLLSIWKGI